MMSTIKYEIGKSYPLRNGGRAVIGYVFENGNAYAMYSNDAAQDYVCPIKFLPDGRAEHGPMAFDILPPEPEKRTVWVNVYANEDGSISPALDVHTNRISCDGDAAIERVHGKNRPRVGCHRITLRAEFEEGEP